MATDYAVLKKGGFMRQKQKNNFSLRLRVVGGNLTAKQLAKIAEVSDKFGDGYVHLTSRQSVEIPFIKLDNIDEVKAALAEGDVEPGVWRTESPYHYSLSGVRQSVQAAVLIHMLLQKNWTTVTLQRNCRISLNSVLQAVRTTV